MRLRRLHLVVAFVATFIVLAVGGLAAPRARPTSREKTHTLRLAAREATPRPGAAAPLPETWRDVADLDEYADQQHVNGCYALGSRLHC
jgi:hypothetical protein